MERLAGVQVTSGNGSAAPYLANVLGFAAEDVAANLAGRLSDAQMPSVRMQVWNRAAGVAVVVGLAIFNCATGADFFWLAILAIAFTVGLYQFVAAVADLKNPVVNLFEGDVTIEGDEDGRRVLRAGNKTLSLTKRTPTAMRSGGPYRIFFLPRAKLVVGAEVLPGWRPIVSPPAKKLFPFSIRIG
jgi:hypothetical protein